MLIYFTYEDKHVHSKFKELLYLKEMKKGKVSWSCATPMVLCWVHFYNSQIFGYTEIPWLSGQKDPHFWHVPKPDQQNGRDCALACWNETH